MTDQEKYVLSEIIRITGDSKSRTFWIKAIKEIGCSRGEQDLGELKYQTHKERKENPGAYLTTLLKERMTLSAAAKKPVEKLNTYFEKTQQDLFRHLKPIPIPKDIVGKTDKMPVPFSGKNIPWPTFLGPEFFTLSTNKKKSDKVKAVFRSIDGEIAKFNLIRGKISPGDEKERGIPTVQHQKVLSAIDVVWAEQGCPHTILRDGTLLCHATMTARDLAKILGWKKFGGRQLNHLKSLIMDLKSMPYCFDFTDSIIKGISNYFFTLLGDFVGFDKIEKGKRTSYFQVYFSSTVSWQLLQRHAVIRPRGMIQIRSELATLLWLYLEPNLRARNNACINLSNLIEVLQLPKASWHEIKNKRKQQFSKAIKEINGQRLADGRQMNIKIQKGLYDWQMIAWLEGYSIKLPGESQPGN